MIREAIKNRIADLGLSQREICAYAVMREQNLSSFLCGTRSFSMRKLSMLLEILGLTVGDARYVVGKFSPAEIHLAVADSVAERGLKLRELSSLCNVNESSLSLFLKGRRLLELESLERVMAALGLELVSYGRPQLL